MEPCPAIDELKLGVSASPTRPAGTVTGVTSNSRDIELEPGVSMPAGPPELVLGLESAAISGSAGLVHGVSALGKIFFRFTDVAPSPPKSASLLI